MNKKNIACIAAAGSGTRMDLAQINKQFLPINKVPLIAHCVNAFDIEEVYAVVVAVQKIHIEQTVWMLKTFCPTAKFHVIEGGNSRNQTIFNMVNFAIKTLEAKEADLIMTHDAARPLITSDIILENIRYSKKYDCIGTAISVNDSVYLSSDHKKIDSTPDRNSVFLAQTPQSFTVKSYQQLKEKLSKEDIDSNLDICSLFHKHGFNVGFSEGSRQNLKITIEEDYTLAKAFAALREATK